MNCVKASDVADNPEKYLQVCLTNNTVASTHLRVFASEVTVLKQRCEDFEGMRSAQTCIIDSLRKRTRELEEENKTLKQELAAQRNETNRSAKRHKAMIELGQPRRFVCAGEVADMIAERYCFHSDETLMRVLKMVAACWNLEYIEPNGSWLLVKIPRVLEFVADHWELLLDEHTVLGVRSIITMGKRNDVLHKVLKYLACRVMVVVLRNLGLLGQEASAVCDESPYLKNLRNFTGLTSTTYWGQDFDTVNDMGDIGNHLKSNTTKFSKSVELLSSDLMDPSLLPSPFLTGTDGRVVVCTEHGKPCARWQNVKLADLINSVIWTLKQQLKNNPNLQKQASLAAMKKFASAGGNSPFELQQLQTTLERGVCATCLHNNVFPMKPRVEGNLMENDLVGDALTVFESFLR